MKIFRRPKMELINSINRHVFNTHQLAICITTNEEKGYTFVDVITHKGLPFRQLIPFYEYSNKGDDYTINFHLGNQRFVALILPKQKAYHLITQKTNQLVAANVPFGVYLNSIKIHGFGVLKNAKTISESHP